MMDVKGGFTYIDVSGLGQFTSGTAKDFTDVSVFTKTQQMDKPIVLVGLDLKTVGKFTATMLSFVSATASGTTTTTATAVTPAFTVAITNKGKITVTKAS